MPVFLGCIGNYMGLNPKRQPLGNNFVTFYLSVEIFVNYFMRFVYLFLYFILQISIITICFLRIYYIFVNN